MDFTLEAGARSNGFPVEPLAPRKNSRIVRMLIRCALILAGAFAVLLAYAGESAGVIPQDSSRYQAHRDTDDTTIAASLLPPDRTGKLFTSDVGKRYIVVEVAVYPKPGHKVDIHLLDFELKSASGEKSRPANPEEVAAIWRQTKPQLPNRVQDVAQGGAAYGSAVNPATGRAEHAWGTYAGEGMGYPLPVYSGGPGANALEAKIRSLALPKGLTDHATAGYLYFPISKRRKGDVHEIEYFQPGGGSISLSLAR